MWQITRELMPKMAITCRFVALAVAAKISVYCAIVPVALRAARNHA